MIHIHTVHTHRMHACTDMHTQHLDADKQEKNEGAEIKHSCEG